MIRAAAISHPGKVFWPEEGYKKRHLIQFYEMVFPRLQPWMEDRLLSLERCPDGVRGECFFQKQAPKGLPRGTPTKSIRHRTKLTRYVVGGQRETQLALANLGCIAVHGWESRASAPRQPDWICFDLDPASGKFTDAVQAAWRLREELVRLELVSYPKTSGGEGMHIFVPMLTGPDNDEVLAFAHEVCRRVAAAYPRELTTAARISQRRKRVFLDVGRNAFAQTVVLPYSVRARQHAPVSTTLDWSEVKLSLDPVSLISETSKRRLESPDPWSDFWKHRQPLRNIKTR
jgi:bifunctional non-homologous end joining protein LigD